ncbi:MAG: hypothetical protein FVQ85_20885 [Planctomycetes bacterium]|nr:hypothetical protein [Planctomycetota bacterium]
MAKESKKKTQNPQQTESLESLTARVEELEKQVGIDRPESRIIEAGAIIILDGNGQKRAELSGLPTADYALSFYNKDGRKTVRLGEQMGQQTTLQLGDGDETIQLSLNVSPLGSYLGLRDANGKRRIQLSVSKGIPGLMMLDENGKPRILLTLTEEGPNFTCLEIDGETPTFSIP